MDVEGLRVPCGVVIPWVSPHPPAPSPEGEGGGYEEEVA